MIVGPRCWKVAIVVACAAWGFFPSGLRAADPQLGRITPYGAQRGTEIDATLAGARLADAQEIVIYDVGIRVAKVEPQKDGSVKARLSVVPDCRLGQHGLRVRTATGISNLILFSVGALKEINEVEPNSDFKNPQKIPLNVTVNGTAENEDVDYFVVEAKKGQRLTAEIEGQRLGQAFFDPSVAILDTNRFVLAEADDTPLVRQDAIASAVVPRDGNYIIQVRESAFGGSGDCRYRLHVGTFPRPLAVYPAGARPGETLAVQWIGDAAGPWIEKITAPTTGPLSSLVARTADGFAPSPNPFRVTDLNNVLETEPNDTPAQATVLQAPAALNGIIAKPGDLDCFKFSAKAGQVFDVRVHARSIRTPLDPVLVIVRSSGAGVASNDDTDTPDSYVRFTAPADDQYVISVQDQLHGGGPEYVYRVEVTAVQPKLTLDLPERSQFVDITAPVPAGNRTAFLVSAQREDFGGEVRLDFKNLPAGVTAEVLPIGPNDTLAPVVFTAAAAAAPSGSLVDVIGRWTEGGRSVEGHLRQRSSLVRGANNREVVNFYANDIATAVTKPVPFAIEIVEPKVPIVQSGTMELKCVAKRQDGFKAPINVQLLNPPPGVSTPGVVTIPEGKSDVIMPLTADGGAAVRKWKIVAIGQATVGDGAVVVSSQMANLEVAEPFFRFAFQTTSVDQGQQANLVVKIEKKKDFSGPAKVELLGLPNEVTAPPREFTKDSTEILFPVKTTTNSPVGQHKTLLCRATITAQGEAIPHLIGSGELRVEKPLPPKTAQEPPKPAAPPPKVEAPKPAPKVLSRLEQLREERKKAGQKP